MLHKQEKSLCVTFIQLNNLLLPENRHRQKVMAANNISNFQQIGNKYAAFTKLTHVKCTAKKSVVKRE